MTPGQERLRDASGAAPHVTMHQMISGFWISRAIYVVAKLGIADLIKDQPRTATELALATGTHAPSLYRVLRALASVQIFSKDANGVAIAGGQKTTLSQSGIGQSQGAKSFAGNSWSTLNRYFP
jgi:hypothetical protein